MKYVKTSVFLLILLLLQTTFFKIIFGDITPNLLLGAAVCYSLYESDFLHSAYFGLVCGLLLDYTTGALFGVATILLVVSCALITCISPHVFKAKLAANALFLFVVGILYELLYFVMCYGLWQSVDYWKILFIHVLPCAIFTMVAGLLVMPWTRRIAAEFSA